VIAALTLIQWPLRVAGSNPTFRPTARTEVRALVPGIIERVMVSEGMPVVRGTTLVRLRDAELRAERDAALAAGAQSDRAAAQAASRGDAAEERLQRSRAGTFREEAAVLDERVGATVVRSPVAGVVLTPRPAERLGAKLEAGDLVLVLGRTDTLELEFGVDQRDIDRVAPGEEVRLRVDALPQHTFTGRVTSIGRLPVDSSAPIRFPVRAAVPNPEGLLRPGMMPYARVLTAPASTVGRLLRGPGRQARLLWWRIWS
jgi:multidrug efflux pump subunit AcrA (membrane-fusion protein)